MMVQLKVAAAFRGMGLWYEIGVMVVWLEIGSGPME